jgi:hypothetical protein
MEFHYPEPASLALDGRPGYSFRTFSTWNALKRKDAMQRRDFLTASVTAAMGLTLGQSVHAAETPQGRQLIEIRIYHFASPEKQSAFEKFFADAAVAALNRAGVEPVGIFKLSAKDNPDLKLAADSTDLYVVLPHKSAESFLQLEDRLVADETYQKVGSAILNTAKSDPAYVRYESTLLLAFEQFPQVKVPGKSPDRLIQLRTYESHNRERAQKKLEMFQQGGELTIFHRSGMPGVFFGEALVGAKLPNLMYMLSFEDDAAKKKGWDAFKADPDWKKVSKEDVYKDTVSNITNLLLRPATGSQI